MVHNHTFKMSADIQTMSLIDLKKLAKEKRIKQYYIKKRSELIELLTMEVLPQQFKIEKMTIAQLRKIAKERGLRGFWCLHRDDLINILFPKQDTVKNTTSNKQDNDQGKTTEHEDPQCHNA